MTAIPLEVLILQVTSRCSQVISVNFGEVAAGVSPRAYVQCGIKVGVRDSTGIFLSHQVRELARYCPSKIQGGDGVTHSKWESLCGKK